MRICVVTDPDDQLCIEEARKISHLLEKSGFSVVASEECDFLVLRKVRVESLRSGIVMVIGSDRLILRTFGRLKKEIPLLGISVSEQSFLSEIDAHAVKSIIPKLKSKSFFFERRRRIVAEFDGEKTPPALNEIGVFSAKSASLIRYSLKIDEQFIWRDSADGLVVATPTGSTGYSLSAGGPILLPTSNSLVITPIASIYQSVKPLVVSNKSKILINGLTSKFGVEIVVDGYHRKRVYGEEVSIRLCKRDAVFLRFEKDFHTKLASKIRAKSEFVTIEDLPPSAKYILKILQYEKSMTQKELIEESLLPARTVRHALEILLKKGLVKKKPSLRDARQDVYMIA
jgi:NAD+ kinase